MSWVDAIGSHPEESRAEQGGDQIQEKSIHELMKNDRRFDEVMIVNPYDPANGAGEGAKVMQFHYAQTPGYGYYSARPYGYYGATPGYGAWGSGWSGVPGYGYAAEPEIAQAGDVGYYADDYPMGYYADPWEGTQWGEADVQPVGYYAGEQPMGYYADGQPVGYYAEEQPVGYYADDYPGYYAVEEPVGSYADGQEMVGWGEQEPIGYYEPHFEGYVREVPPAYNPGCPMPTNVAGFGDTSLEGYVRPQDVSPTCENFKPQPSATAEAPETFRPLW